MKLIMESWRRFLTEAPITKLRIFDFDETIAFTDSEVRVIDPSGKKFAFDDQKKYDIYVKQVADLHKISTINPDGTARDAVTDLIKLGYDFDFDDFENVNNPKMNEMVVKILGRVVGANRLDPQREIYIMTARGPGSKRPIMTYLLSLKRKTGEPRFKKEDFADIITLSGGSKQKAVDELIKKHTDEDGNSTIREISFFDDSQRNLDDVKQLEGQYPNIVFAIEKVEGAEITRLSEDELEEAEYQGREVTLNKPTRGDVKKFKVYVKDPKTGNVKKVNFGHGGTSAKAKGEKTMKIRKNNPKARKSFRARHNCDSPGPKTKARYWSCKKW